LAYQPPVLFSQSKPTTSTQPAVLFSQNKPAPAISHQPNEQAVKLAPKRKLSDVFETRKLSDVHIHFSFSLMS
jgi:hypothetical protein